MKRLPVFTPRVRRTLTPALLAAATLGHFGVGATGARAAESPPRRPNVIVILADDQGYADLGVQHQVPNVRTPHLDALAARGVRMTSAYVTSPQCSPSRAGLITGRYQQRFGLESIPDDPLPLEEVTIPERLHHAGYVSGMVGKWHLDPNALSLKWARTHLPGVKPDQVGRIEIPKAEERRFSSLAQGFDECYQGEMSHYFATYDLQGQSLDPQGREVDNRAYRLDVQTDAALAFLQRHHEQPFFLYLAYFGPHVPLEATPEYLARFPGKMPERRRHALAMLSAIDDGVGRITAALAQYGIADDTLVVFTSDNGAPLFLTKPDTKPINANGWDGSLNDPWLGEKGMLAEGGIRVPFLMCWPGHLPAGKVYESPVSTLDIAATTVALAGLPHDDRLDGTNLMPFLTGKSDAAPHETLYWRFWNQSAIRQGRWKYIRVGTTRRFLFDLASDAPEARNVIAEHPEIAQALATRLSAWTAKLSPPGDLNTPLHPAGDGKAWTHYFGPPTR